MKKHIPLLVFVASAAIGLALTYVILESERTSQRQAFEILADDAVDRIRDRTEQNFSLIVATHSFLGADGAEITRSKFQSFALGLFLKGKLSGMQGIGFARLIKSGNEDVAVRELRRNYDLERPVWPREGQDHRTPIVLLEPLDVRNKAALGYDMFSDAVRRTAMLTSADTLNVSASAPVMLVQEITEEKQTGFLAYLPLSAAGGRSGETFNGEDFIDGFVYAPFRAGDLHSAALTLPTPVPVLVRTVDVTDTAPELLFESEAFSDKAGEAAYLVTRQIDVGGRAWEISVIDAVPRQNGFAYWRTFMLGAVSLLFSAALAVSVRSRLKAREANRRLKEMSEKTIQEKDLMLQEMKHRIKNSIARILAIARQTAGASQDLEAFSESFGARLQAMANAQDLLTRSHWAKADLRALLLQELQQVFGDGAGNVRLEGPAVQLDETGTHALGLVFHELATNAMKYSEVFNDGGCFEVTWRTEVGPDGARLELDWREETGREVAAPQTFGFGSRLIEALIGGEMSGRFDRQFNASGVAVSISVPLKRA
ncbi:CHASE domain-containing protein [Roseibium sp. AS2]|uniref:CHASE domain-containing protein n=1 Tax=Roseibium sp. AS2 TaxID=3135781 RepID=UPI00317F164B